MDCREQDNRYKGLEGGQYIMRILLWIPPILFLVSSIILCMLLAKRGKGLYDNYIIDLDKKEWSLKDYLYIGFAWEAWGIGEKMTKSFASAWNRYKNNVYSKILLLYGKYRGSEQMYYVYEANKVTLSLLLLAGISLFSPLLAVSRRDISMAYKLDAISVLLALALPFLIDYSLNGKLKEREKLLLLQFPAFGSKLVLLLGAGMTVSKAIRRIVVESPQNTVLMTELSEMLRNIEAGAAETAAYEEFARRCHVKEINRFVSVLVQSIQKSGHGTAMALSLQVQECWNARKDMAKTLGQEASTKLVFPLMLMMLSILFMVGGPALLMFSQM